MDGSTTEPPHITLMWLGCILLKRDEGWQSFNISILIEMPPLRKVRMFTLMVGSHFVML